MSTNWKRAYNEYLRGHNGHGDPLSYDEFRDRLETHGQLRPDSDPKTTKARPPVVREVAPGTSDDPLDYDLNDEGATGSIDTGQLEEEDILRQSPLFDSHRQAIGGQKPGQGRA